MDLNPSELKSEAGVEHTLLTPAAYADPFGAVDGSEITCEINNQVLALSGTSSLVQNPLQRTFNTGALRRSFLSPLQLEV